MPENYEDPTQVQKAPKTVLVQGEYVGYPQDFTIKPSPIYPNTTDVVMGWHGLKDAGEPKEKSWGPAALTFNDKGGWNFDLMFFCRTRKAWTGFYADFVWSGEEHARYRLPLWGDYVFGVDQDFPRHNHGTHDVVAIAFEDLKAKRVSVNMFLEFDVK